MDEPEHFEYQEQLGHLRFGTYPYTKESDQPRWYPKKWLPEIQQLKHSLPVTWDNAIFLRWDENDVYHLKVLMTGARATPYDSGLLCLDLRLPKNYPEEPPKVTLEGVQGKINPSIYGSGVVTMTLLNNWGGNPEERWRPNYSNLYQVLVSIQSLLLNENPYFNETGKDREIHTRTGEHNSFMYNSRCYVQTIQELMVRPLQKPPLGFEEIVKKHFELKREHIMELLYPAWRSLAIGTASEELERLGPRLKMAFDGPIEEESPEEPDEGKPVLETVKLNLEDDDLEQQEQSLAFGFASQGTAHYGGADFLEEGGANAEMEGVEMTTYHQRRVPKMDIMGLTDLEDPLEPYSVTNCDTSQICDTFMFNRPTMLRHRKHRNRKTLPVPPLQSLPDW